MNDSVDVVRLRREYENRKARLGSSEVYSHFNTANLYIIHSRERAVLALLRRHGLSSLGNCRILEVGSGHGGALLDYLSYGASPHNLHGADILMDRVVEAHSRLPHLPLVCADGRYLPYPAASFGLVSQSTVFSSILDPGVKRQLAAEMLRVLRPGGLIAWYDFWLNPTNKQTRGIRPPEIRQLFPGCQFDFRRITLAPPLARMLAPRSWLLCHVLETLRLLNTHYLVAIKPLPDGGLAG